MPAATPARTNNNRLNPQRLRQVLLGSVEELISVYPTTEALKRVPQAVRPLAPREQDDETPLRPWRLSFRWFRRRLSPCLAGRPLKCPAGYDGCSRGRLSVVRLTYTRTAKLLRELLP